MSKSYLKFLCTASTTNMETDDVFSCNTYAKKHGETLQSHLLKIRHK